MELSLDLLLCLGWIAGTVPILVASIPATPFRRLRGILSEYANRGKTFSSSSKILTVPQSYFLHFYVVAVLWTTCLLGCVWVYACGKLGPLASTGGLHLDDPQVVQVWRAVFALLLMEIQVVRRLYESICVFNYSSSARMHTFGYLTGLYFYTATPLSFGGSSVPKALSYLSSQVPEIIAKGQVGVFAPECSWWGWVKRGTGLGWCQWIGTIIFMWGWMHQLRCHAILGSLRKHLGVSEYVIPHGDWFEIVSCPHYLAEIVIYAGILVGSGGLDPTLWILFIFVIANLAFVAADTHKWYHRKFDNYPRSRHAILPLIY